MLKTRSLHVLGLLFFSAPALAVEGNVQVDSLDPTNRVYLEKFCSYHPDSGLCHFTPNPPVRHIYTPPTNGGISVIPGPGTGSFPPPSNCGAKLAGPGIVRSWDPRTVRHSPGRSGKGVDAHGPYGLIENLSLPPAEEYYLDFTLTFGPKFDWETPTTVNGHTEVRQSGKIPGLATIGGERTGGGGEGGNGTGNCSTARSDGWSARNTFGPNGEMEAYLYSQNRESHCGSKFSWRNADGSLFRFTKGTPYRVTQRVKINTPGQPNGEDQIWVNGMQVLLKRDIEWRGKVSSSVARVDGLKYHNYYGGNNASGPTYESFVNFCNLYVMSCAPDFTKPPGTCRN